MAESKYKIQYEEMIENHKAEFEEFKKTAALYKKSPTKYKDALIDQQKNVLWFVRKAENRLCSKTENTKYADFSTTLAEKFWELVRKDYPEVDLVLQ